MLRYVWNDIRWFCTKLFIGTAAFKFREASSFIEKHYGQGLSVTHACVHANLLQLSAKQTSQCVVQTNLDSRAHFYCKKTKIEHEMRRAISRH